MAERIWLNVIAVIVVMMTHGVFAQDQPPELTPVGKAILQSQIAVDGRPMYDQPGPSMPMTFPLAMCTFLGGLCGAVHRDGTVAVPPRYDWVGTFSDNRAAVRLSGLYGFVDEEGREIVKPQYRIVGDYKFGFAQVDVDGKSGLIDRDGKTAIAPKYGSIHAISPDRFQVSENRRLGGMVGGEDFSDSRVEYTPSGGAGVTVFGSFLAEFLGNSATGIIDISGQRIDMPSTSWFPQFDKDDPSIQWVQRDKRWGLVRADGSWLIEPVFLLPASLNGGLALVTVNGKIGFIDRTGNFAIPPVFDKAWPFNPGFARTSAERDGIFGVIDKSGAWVFRTNYQQIYPATSFGANDHSVFGWHFKKADRWGLLDLDGRVVLDADFDQAVNRCADGRLEAYKNRESFYFRADGTSLQPPEGRLVDASCGVPPYTLKIGDKFGLVDANFNPLTPVQFDAIARVAPGVRNAKIDGKWGRVGPDGHWLLEPKFDYLSNGVDVFVASVDGRRGFMQSDGTWLIEPKFDAARVRGDDTAFVTIADATGILRLKDQSWVIPPRPGAMCDTNNAIVSQAADGKRVVLSRTGETWIDIGTERIGLNLDFGLLTFLRDGSWGLVDTAGQVMVEPQFDEPVYFIPKLRGVAWAKRDGRWCTIDRHGRSVPGIPCADTDPMGFNRRFECKVEP
jgi:WG containing repeat